MANETINKKNAEIAARTAAQQAAQAAGVPPSVYRDAPVKNGDALMAITYESGGEGRKGKG